MRTLGTTLAALLLTLPLAACGDETEPEAQAQPTSEPTPTPSASPLQPPEPPGHLESTTLPRGDLNVVGAWETGELVGERLDAGTAFGLPQVLYAVTSAESEQGHALVSLGLEHDDRIFRTLPALVPATEEAPDGIDLYGGDEVDGAYQLMGAVPGAVSVTIETPDGRAVPASAQSGAVLPGYTVFHHRGEWQPGWNPIELAPLVVTTDDGARVEVRERSWTG